MTKQNEVEKLQAQLDTNRQETAQRQKEAAGIIAKFTDATGAARDKLSEKWRSVQSDIELLDGERCELQRRYDVTVQAVTEYNIQQAQAVYNVADKAAREKRAVLIGAQDAKLRFMNVGGRKAESEASINKVKELEIAIATAQA